jgi:uncharacterized membrane protein
MGNKYKSWERSASGLRSSLGTPFREERREPPELAGEDALRSQVRIAYAALLFVSLAWLTTIVAAPALMARGHVLSAMVIYRSLSGICHQIPERSFYLRGFPLAVCSRCTGIYVGFVIGLMFYPFVRSLHPQRMPSRRWLIAACLPVLIDFGGNYLGLFKNTFVSRAVTGALLGVAFSVYILTGLISVVEEWGAIRASRFVRHRANAENLRPS